MNHMNLNSSVIVSWDFTRGRDTDILLVGKQTKGKMEVVNAFQGQEAMDIFKMFTTVKEKKDS